jgi:hypothetical protein
MINPCGGTQIDPIGRDILMTNLIPEYDRHYACLPRTSEPTTLYKTKLNMERNEMR